MAQEVGSNCGICGGALHPGDRFCGNCGSSAVGGNAPAEDTDTSHDTVWARVLERLRSATAGEYEVSHEIGSGGMAAVYLAQDVRLNRKVAIKVMSPSLLATRGMVERFHDEAVTVAQLSHANIVTIYTVRQVEDLHFFVMKLVEGRSLEAVIQERHTLPLPLVRAVLFDVMNALAYAHRRGVVHRDIKPANILLDTEGNVVVTDFGISKVTEAPRRTMTGALIGTPAYMSPEQCLGHETTAASDQYAVGIVAYEMLTGQAPFTGPTLMVVRAHVDLPVPPIETLRPDGEEELNAVVMRMLEKKPGDRFPSLADALAALNVLPLSAHDHRRRELATLGMPDAETAAKNQIPLSATPVRVTPRAHDSPMFRATPSSPPAQVHPTPSAPSPTPSGTPPTDRPFDTSDIHMVATVAIMPSNRKGPRGQTPATPHPAVPPPPPPPPPPPRVRWHMAVIAAAAAVVLVGGGIGLQRVFGGPGPDTTNTKLGTANAGQIAPGGGTGSSGNTTATNRSSGAGVSPADSTPRGRAPAVTNPARGRESSPPNTRRGGGRSVVPNSASTDTLDKIRDLLANANGDTNIGYEAVQRLKDNADVFRTHDDSIRQQVYLIRGYTVVRHPRYAGEACKILKSLKARHTDSDIATQNQLDILRAGLQSSLGPSFRCDA